VPAVIRPKRPIPRADDSSVRRGLSYARSNPAIPWLLLATFAVGRASDPVGTPAPAYVEMVGPSSAFAGAQLTAFGIGAAIAIVGVGAVQGRIGRNQAPLAGTAILAADALGYAAAPSPSLALASLFVAGVGSVVAMSTTNSNWQGRLAEVMRGGVMALWLMAYLSSKPFAGLIDGAFADIFPPRGGGIVAAISLTAVALSLSLVEGYDTVTT